MICPCHSVSTVHIHILCIIPHRGLHRLYQPPHPPPPSDGSTEIMQIMLQFHKHAAPNSRLPVPLGAFLWEDCWPQACTLVYWLWLRPATLLPEWLEPIPLPLFPTKMWSPVFNRTLQHCPAFQQVSSDVVAWSCIFLINREFDIFVDFSVASSFLIACSH